MKLSDDEVKMFSEKELEVLSSIDADITYNINYLNSYKKDLDIQIKKQDETLDNIEFTKLKIDKLKSFFEYTKKELLNSYQESANVK